MPQPPRNINKTVSTTTFVMECPKYALRFTVLGPMTKYKINCALKLLRQLHRDTAK